MSWIKTLVCSRHLENSWMNRNVDIFILYNVIWQPIRSHCEGDLSFNIHQRYGPELPKVSSFSPQAKSNPLPVSTPPAPPLSSRWLFTMPTISGVSWTMGSGADPERAFFFFTADVISSHYGSLQSNSDFGTWTSTFLMHGPRSLFRSGSEWVSLRYCSTSPFVHLKEPGLSLPSRYFVNLNGSFRKRAQSFVLPFFIFLILSVRPNLDNSDLTSSVNTAIPIFSSMKHLWTVCWGCLSCLWHSLILIFFLLSP